MAANSHGVTLDPPFRGYIETTFDALLVFEAAKRGMIPRVTRRLIERERSMVQSGAVFVFDEQESGIKRWTDGLTWSPSRILGNFLVYRETDKPSNGAGGTSPSQIPAQQPRVSTTTAGSMAAPHGDVLSTTPPSAYAPPLGQGALQRPRSVSEGDGQGLDRQRERQLVGSLTNSYKFKGDGLVKKTMSVTVNGYTQHMISYYNLDDVTAGRLRTPSTILELAALEISPDYLAKQNFRFPPQIEVGPDGIPRYRGELEEPGSSPTPSSGPAGFYLPPGEIPYDPYGGSSAPPSAGAGMARYDHPPEMRQRTHSLAAPIPIPGPHSHPPPPPHGAQQMYYPPPSPYYDHGAPQLSRDGSGHGPAPRPRSSQGRRYDPYGGQVSPRSSGNVPMPGTSHRRLSQTPAPLTPVHQGGPPPAEYYPPPTSASSSSAYDIKPSSLPMMSHANPFAYNPPATSTGAPASFGGLYLPEQHSEPPLHSPGMPHPYQPSPTQNHAYPQWPNAGQTSRLIPSGGGAGQPGAPVQSMRPPGSAGSSGSPTSLPAPGSSGADRNGWPNANANPNPGVGPGPSPTNPSSQAAPRSHLSMPISPLGQPPWNPRHHPHAHAHAPPGVQADARTQQHAYAVDQWQ